MISLPVIVSGAVRRRFGIVSLYHAREICGRVLPVDEAGELIKVSVPDLD